MRLKKKENKKLAPETPTYIIKNKMGGIRVYMKTKKILTHQKLKLQNYMMLK